MKNKKEVAIFISVIYGLRQVFSSRVKGIEHSEEKVTRCEEQQLKGRCVCVCVEPGLGSLYWPLFDWLRAEIIAHLFKLSRVHAQIGRYIHIIINRLPFWPLQILLKRISFECVGQSYLNFLTSANKTLRIARDKTKVDFEFVVMNAHNRDLCFERFLKVKWH